MTFRDSYRVRPADTELLLAVRLGPVRGHPLVVAVDRATSTADAPCRVFFAAVMLVLLPLLPLGHHGLVASCKSQKYFCRRLVFRPRSNRAARACQFE
jgi:hypothetical protein